MLLSHAFLVLSCLAAPMQYPRSAPISTRTHILANGSPVYSYGSLRAEQADGELTARKSDREHSQAFAQLPMGSKKHVIKTIFDQKYSLDPVERKYPQRFTECILVTIASLTFVFLLTVALTQNHSPSGEPLGITKSVKGTHLSGITYNPYRTRRQCATESMIDEDLSIISKFAKSIRTYATECGHEKWIFKSAAKYNLDLTIGLWVNENNKTFDRQLGNLMTVLSDRATTHSQKERLKAVVVGNEAIYRNEVTIPELATYIRTARSQLTAVGLPDVLITTSDIPSSFENPLLVKEIDFLLPNLHVFFDGMDIAQAPGQLWSRFDHLQQMANGKQVVIGETGWPSAGNPWGNHSAGIPTEANAKYLLNTFLCEANRRKLDYFYFDAFDAYWKMPSSEEEEYHWGLMTSERENKDYTVDALVCTKESYAWVPIPSCNHNPYDPKTYSCTSGTLLCPLPLQGCGQVDAFSCYNPSLDKCVKGLLAPLPHITSLRGILDIPPTVSKPEIEDSTGAATPLPSVLNEDLAV